MSKTFCAMPFQHICVGPEGTARVCCMTGELVSEHGAPMSLNVNSMDEIWNSAYMRDIRRGMLKGERISACEVCYGSEEASGQSYRTTTGLAPLDGPVESAESMAKYGASAGYRVDERPGFIKMEISNLCNLKCRMCYGGASSQIERDPVHNRWSGGIEPLHAVWRGETARLGPEPRIGVRVSGLLPHESYDGGIRRWTDGHATLSVPVRRGTRLKSLDVTFCRSGALGQNWRIFVCGRPMARGVAAETVSRVSIDLRGFDAGEELTVEIVSDRVVQAAGERERGVALRDIDLSREAPVEAIQPPRPQHLSPRLATEGPWYVDDRKVFDDVLKSAGSLKRLYFTGGEPLINDRVAEILQHLVDTGDAAHVHLELSTNCTSVDPRFIERIKKFHRVEMLLSLDSVGATYEYIRYPARWSVIEANVRRLKYEHGLICKVPPVVQVYNVLGLVDLYRFCDEHEMEVIMNILCLPDRLAISHLPPKVRAAAAAKLFAYHDADCRPRNKPSVLSLANHLKSMETPLDRKVMRELMLFTNDLDATRGQSFRETHAEMVALLAEDGFEWTDETM
ncbi:MAG: radical SAM protein [Rhodospirillales bacterium]|nr:MAG: radical SAM protein [Rhodospirillales bacterium]